MSPKEQKEDPRAAAGARLAEAKLMLRQMATSSLLMTSIGLWSIGALAVVVPIAIGVLSIAGWRYHRAKRELAALDNPPTARLLR